MVGRSENLFGPYVDRNGEEMLSNHYETVLKGNGAFAGPGHNAEIVTDRDGTDWLLYHAYWVNSPSSRHPDARPGELDRRLAAGQRRLSVESGHFAAPLS